MKYTWRAVALVALLAACGGSNEKTIENATSGSGSNRSDAAVSTTTTAASTTTVSLPSGPELTLTDSGFSIATYFGDERRLTAAAEFKNTGDVTAVFSEVVFTFKDAAGKPVATETAYLDAVDPGNKAYAIVDAVEWNGADPASLSVDGTYSEDSIFDGAQLSVTVGGVGPEEYGGYKVHGTAKNTASEIVESTSVDCALRKAGKIVGGVEGYLDQMSSGAEIAWEATTSAEGLAFDEAVCSAGYSS